MREEKEINIIGFGKIFLRYDSCQILTIGIPGQGYKLIFNKYKYYRNMRANIT